MSCVEIEELISLLKGESKAKGGNCAGSLLRLLGALMLSPALCTTDNETSLAPVILDVLEVGKSSTLDPDQEISYLILAAHAMNFGSVRHLLDISPRLPRDLVPSTHSALPPCSASFLRGLRYLYRAKKLRSFKSLNMGTLLQLAFEVREGEGGGDIIRYQALRLLCESLQLPHSYSLSLLGRSFDSHLLSNMIWTDVGNDVVQPGVIENSGTGDEAVMFDGIRFKQYGAATVNVAGITLPTARTEPSWISDNLVHTGTSLRNLRLLAQGVSIQAPIVVEGESGCGKSFLIKELAALMGKRDTLLELHLDDQTDSKALIGSYVCSDVPGEFVWQPGLVTQAAASGTWLLIEDIDKASLEVIATLTPILESGRVPNGVGDDVPVHPAFRIFGSRTIAAGAGGGGSDGTLAAKHVPNFRHFSYSWHVITFEMNSIEEVEGILTSKYPHIISSLRTNLLNTYTNFRKHVKRDGAMGKISGLKSFSLRDLLKTAERFSRDSALLLGGVGSKVQKRSNYVTEQLRLNCVADVVDVFLGSIRRRNEQYRQLVMEIGCGNEEGEGWGLSEEVLEAHIFQRSPEVSIKDDVARVGRAEFSMSDSSSSLGDEAVKGYQQQFAFTKHALRLLETIAVCVSLNEPVLLVGETGTGKTTSVQELATMLRQTLVVQNISLSTDSSDLLGGFRPVSLRQLFQPSYEHFVSLFRATFSQTQNSEYLYVVAQYFRKEQWKKMLKAFQKAGSNALKKVNDPKAEVAPTICLDDEHVAPAAAWTSFLDVVRRLVCNLPKITHGFAFAFVNGLLVEAMRKGHWVLLDEINLASPETLQGLVGILDGQSLCLTEKGDIKPIFRHPNFRIFAAMNPPTDVGKRELPETLRGRFTEIFVEEMEDRQDLQVVVQRYLQHLSDGVSSASAISDIVDIYLGCRATAEQSLVDGGGHRPHYSLRSLTRALKACNSFMELGFRPLNRALYEGFLLSFQTQLNPTSRLFMSSFLLQCLDIKGGKSMSLPPPRPGGRKSTGDEWVLLKPYWLRRGPVPSVDWSEPDARGITKFVMTETVEKNIRDLARAVSADITSVLLQGPTSVGKTTMVEFLAAKCGYRCIRINNHEHTDVQEYVGGYVTGSDGRLVFKDGVLVEALRRGDWIILDELNLAPSDVLEALNRLLDDNKELFIPETGEIVKPAPGFFLFATQNPAGAYGGRKPLSRAFRNRFIEISICDLPFPEVEHIVSQSCGIPPKYSKCLVSVMKEMQMRRQQSSILQGKYGSITTRDLIKWGRRRPQSPVDIVREGFMILAEKHRGSQEKEEILEVLLQACKVGAFDTSTLYEFATEEQAASVSAAGSLSDCTFEALEALRQFQTKLRDSEVSVDGVGGIAITFSVRRLWTLVSRCMDNAEPVLLIGETGTGKTTVCQLVAAERNQRIRIVNCHQSTETADIIGGLRPVRGRAGLLHQLHGYVRQIMAADGHSLPQVEELMTALDRHRDGEGDDVVDNEGDGVEPVAVDETLLSNAMSELSVRLASLSSPDSAPEDESPGSKKLKLSHEEGGKAAGREALSSSDLPRLMAAALELWRRYMSLFEWQDGPLVEAMKHGDVFILDEINLAEDAVIERLNSVLESSRTLTLAERGSQADDGDDDSNVVVVAHPNFRFLATMNPGDDYGKRELSPALRSRFSEMWVPNVTDSDDIVLIISEMMNISAPDVDTIAIAHIMVDFMTWMNETSAAKTMVSIKMSIREVLAWARFICNWGCCSALDAHIAFVHGAQMLVLDGLGIGTSISQELITELKTLGLAQLLALCPPEAREAVLRTVIPVSLLNATVAGNMPRVEIDSDKLSVGFFNISLGDEPPVVPSSGYILDATSTVVNFQRILRAMKLPRPILLEGPPGVGKTSLVANLAALTGHKLVRINLSEHSELSDLIGTDLPSSNNSGEASSSKFNWCDGVFLTALKQGDWILLDELNLAPQSVLEGLNACFDHRGEVFIPEIGKSFHCPPSFRVFCAQNPMSEGGGRKGLPQSFLTRFSRVFVEAMDGEDMVQICMQAYQDKLPAECLAHVRSMVQLVQALQLEISANKSFARSGSPWEFNLRDAFRWCDLLSSRICTCRMLESAQLTTAYLLADAAHTLFVSRLRSHDDRRRVCAMFLEVFGFALEVDLRPQTFFSGSPSDFKVMIGCEVLEMSAYLKIDTRAGEAYWHAHPLEKPLRGPLLKTLEAAAACVRRQWPLLLAGATSSGKRRVVRHLAYITGNMTNLVEFSATPTTDATELLGSFEQASVYRHLNRGVMLLNRLCCMLTHAALVLHEPGDGEVRRLVVSALSLYHAASSAVEQVTADNSLMLHSDKQLELNKETSSIFLQLETLLASIKQALGACYAASHSGGVNMPLLPESEALACIDQSEGIFQMCKTSCNQTESSGNFEWVDGIVVRALEQGLWLLVDNVNLCSSSVLDRLNSLLEPGGYLLLTESGAGRIVRPHKNFRLFFTMDHTYGEISRAMRNRCVEIAVICGEDKHVSAPTTTATQVADVVIGGDIALLTVQALSSSVFSESLLNKLTTLYRVLAGRPNCPSHRLFQRTCDVFRMEMSCCANSSVDAALQRAVACVVPFIFQEFQEQCESCPADREDNLKDNAGAAVDVSRGRGGAGLALQTLYNISPYLSSHTFFTLFMVWIVETRDEIPFSGHCDWLSYSLTAGRPSMSLLANEIEAVLSHQHHSASDKELTGGGGVAAGGIRPAASSVSSASIRAQVYARLRRCCASLASPLEMQVVQAFFLQHIQLFSSAGSHFADSERLQESLFSRTSASPTFDILRKNIEQLGLEHLVSVSQLELFQRGHDRLQSRIGIYGLINQGASAESARDAIIVMRLFEVFTALEERVLGCRHPILWWEEQATLGANMRVFSEAVSSYMDHVGAVEGLSLFSVAVIAVSDEELNDCREGSVLCSLHALMASVDSVALPLYSHALAAAASEGSQATSALLEAYEDVLSCRDQLSAVLLTSSPNISAMPWGHFDVCLRWMRKRSLALMCRVQAAGCKTSSQQKHLSAACSILCTALDSSFLAICTYWKTSFQCHKLRLWKDGGHAALPVRKEDWLARRLIKNSLLAAAGAVKLPGFVDMSLPRMDSSFSTQHMDWEKMNSNGNEELILNHTATMSHKIRRNAAMMKEWLCLYSTFYWSCSNEIPDDFMKRKNSDRIILDFDSLIKSLGSQFEATLKAIPSELNLRARLATAADSAGDSSWSAVIDDEIESAGWLFTVIAAEPTVATLLSDVSNLLGKLCLILFQSAITAKRSASKKGAASSNAFTLSRESLVLMRALHQDVAALLLVALKATLFDMTLLRELQTLAWFLDALLLAESGEHKDALSLSAAEEDVLRRLLTSFSVMIDVRLHSVMTANLSNSLNSVQFRWGSELLTRLVGRSSVYGELDDAEDVEADEEEQVVCQLSASQVMNTGAVRIFHQAVTLELVLRLLDASGLSLPLAAHPDLRAFLVHDVPTLTLSSCQQTRRTLLGLFRQTVKNGSLTKSQRTASSRLDLLQYFTFSTVFSCRDYLSTDKFDTILALVKSINEGVNFNCDLFAALADLQLGESCLKNPVLSTLFCKCLTPLLHTLVWTQAQSKDGAVTDTYVWAIELAKAWVHLGLLRLNLLIPQSPVDPSVKPSIKVELLSQKNEDLEQAYAAHELQLSLAGAARRSPQMLSFAHQHTGNANKIRHLAEKVIFRPDDVPLFTDLYQELREASDSLLDVDRVLGMLATASSLAASVAATDWASGPSASRAAEDMSRLAALAREELSWQESLAGFVSRVLNVYQEYEDVVSPVLSAISSISQGLRTVVSWSVSWSEECVLLRSCQGSAGLGRCAASVLSVPSLAALRVGVGGGGNGLLSLKKCIVSSVEDLEKFAEPLITRGCAKLALAREADPAIPLTALTANHSSTCVRFLALSRIEYLLGSNVADPGSLDAACAEFICRFVSTYVCNAEARKLRAVRKSSLYQYKDDGAADKKSSEAIFTSNDEQEELEDLQRHFPDHLRGVFADIVLRGDQDLNGEGQGGEGGEAAGAGNLQVASAGGASTKEDEEAEVEGKLIEEDGTVSSLISFHMRKIFIHCYLQRQKSGANWVKSLQNIHSDPGTQRSIAQDLQTSLQMTMFENLLMTGKMLQWGLGQANCDTLAADTRGFSLLVLQALAAESGRGVQGGTCTPLPSGKLSYGWIERMAGAFESLGRPVDRDLLLLLEDKCVSDWNPLNFQTDANPSEIARASDPVKKILQSTMDILAMFPGNEILVVICQICARILQFPITVAVGKMLASVEFLLVRMQEWEQYAARHVSLKGDMQALVALISDWRRLELRSWADLLRCKEVVYASRAKKMWFTLSSLLSALPDNLAVRRSKSKDDASASANGVAPPGSWTTLEKSSSTWLRAGHRVTVEVLEAGLNGHYNTRTLNAPEQQSKAKANADLNYFDEDVYLQTVFEALDGFLRSSVVGEFPTRLHLVRLFALDLSQASRGAPSVSTTTNNNNNNNKAAISLQEYTLILKQKMSFICYGVWQYYEQFLGAARKLQNQLKSPIQQRLKDEIKISRWDQLNTYAVIEHSAKVHRKLNKILREYATDVLDFPVSAIFTKEVMGSLVGEQGDLSGAVAIPPSRTIFPVLGTYHVTLSAEEPAVVVDGEDEDEEEDESEEEKVRRQEEKARVRAREEAARMPPPPVYEEAPDSFPGAFARHLRLQPRDHLEQLKAPGAAFLMPERSSRVLQTFRLQHKVFAQLTRMLCLQDESAGVSGAGAGDEAGGGGRKARFGYQAADVAESLCTDIFYRVDVLRSKEAGKSAPKNVKHRAMTELLKRLKEEGVSHLKSDVPGEMRRPVEIFALSPLLHEEFASDLGHAFDPSVALSVQQAAAGGGGGGSMLEKAEAYFIRNVCEVNQLRVQVTAPISGDITAREAAVMLGQAENMLYSALRTRAAVSAAISDFHAMSDALEKLKQLVSAPEVACDSAINYIPDQLRVAEMYEYRRCAGSAVLCSLGELKHLLAAAAEANVPSSGSSCTSTECVAAVESWKIDAVFKSLQELISAVQNSISPQHDDSASSLATSKLFSEGLGLDMVSASHSSMSSSGRVFSPRDVRHLRDSSSDLSARHHKFASLATHLAALLSADVTQAVARQVLDYAAELKGQAAALHSVETELLDDHSVRLVLLDPSSSVLSEGLDKCLLAVQNLKILKSGKLNQNFNGNFGELIAVAKVKGGEEGEEERAEEQEQEKSLVSCLSLSHYSFSVLKLPGITESLQQLLHLVSSQRLGVGAGDFSVLQAMVSSSLPVFDCIAATVVVLIEDLLSSYKSFGKLLYVCTRMFRVLLTKGFCSDETKDGDGEGGGDGDVSKMTFEDDVEGTGMGDGEGHKDVSDQIENEEQLLGLKGDSKNEEQKSDRQLNEEEKDQGVDMMQDFDGDMCDLPDNDNKDEEEEEKEDAEREMGGELDLDNIVDEKEWGEDEDDAGSDEDQQQQKDETFEDSKGEGETIEGEMVTNKNDDEEKKDEQGDKQDKGKEEQKEKESSEQEEGAEEGAGVNEEEEMLDKPLGVDVQKEQEKEEGTEQEEQDEGEPEEGGVMDEEQQSPGEGKEEGADLPDNMDLGEDEDEDGGDQDQDQEDAMDQEPDADDANPDNDEDDDDDKDDKENDEDNHSNMHGGEDKLNEEVPEPVAEDPSEDSAVDDAASKKDDSGSTVPTFGVQSAAGKDSMMQQQRESEEEEEDRGEGGKDGNEDDKQPDNSSGSRSKSEDASSGSEGRMSGSKSSSGDTDEGEQKDQQKQAQRNMEPPNPFRQQGDINEKWHRRLNVQSSDEKSDEKDNKQSKDKGEKGTYEYDMMDEEGGNDQEQSDMQVLAESTEQEAVQLPTPAETKEEGAEEDEEEGMDEEQPDEDSTAESKSKSSKKRGREQPESTKETAGDDEAVSKRSCQGKDEEDEEESGGSEVAGDEDDGEKQRASQEDAARDAAAEESAFNTRGGIMVRNVDEWLARDEARKSETARPQDASSEDDELDCDALSVEKEGEGEVDMEELARAREQWSLLTAVHKADCIRLCEQLRLVLEPTLASRLQGDYRTGKRINMRRVISYVASGFRKDKIWMRRTKPSKRDYQVMMMIDDSSSMGQAGPLAMSALNVISGALSRLEVGSIGVCAFSERLTPMHAFSSPFTDEAGAKMYSQFKFQASQTRLAHALQSVVPMFEDARRLASTSSSVVLQICFVISDARIDSDNREKLNTIVRELAEKNILAVLIIIDKNDDHNDSIFATKTVEFTPAGLVTRGYLDEFPFPYYVAIQQVEALPDVLSDVLKQWFELVQSQLND